MNYSVEKRSEFVQRACSSQLDLQKEESRRRVRLRRRRISQEDVEGYRQDLQGQERRLR